VRPLPARVLPLAWLACALAAAGGCGAPAADSPAAAAGTSDVLGALDTLDVGAAPGSVWPNLAAGPDGALVLSWLEPLAPTTGATPSTAPRGTPHRLRFAALRDGAWTAPRTIAERSDLLVNWSDFPAVVPMGGARLAAWWPVMNPNGDFAYDAVVATSADGGATWSAGARPHRDGTATEHGFVSFVPAGARGDSTAVVWLDGRDYARPAASGADHRMQLAVATLGGDGAPGPERMLDTDVCSCCRTSAARTRGGVVVAYRDRQPGEVRNIAVVRHEAGVWSAPATVHDDGWVIPGCPTNGSAVAAHGDTVAVAWFTAPRDSARVTVALSVDGGRSFRAPVRVDGGSPAGRVGVAVDAEGAALVTWIERVDASARGARWRDAERAARGRPAGDAELRVRRVALDGALGAPQTVAASTAGRGSGFPQVAAAGGAVYLAWTEPASGGAPPRLRVVRARPRPAVAAR
jgi:hypothetical protein